MKKQILVILTLCALFTCTLNQTFAQTSSCLEDDLVLDFSETQFNFSDPMGLWFIFKFKATNVGTNDLLINFNKYCEENPTRVPVCAPQGETLLAPGESMWFKMLLCSDECAYDPSVTQTVERTLFMEFVDLNNNWGDPNHKFSVTKTIQIEVNGESVEGDVLIQGTTVDDQGTPIPNVDIDIGGYGRKAPTRSDNSGHFSYSLAENPVYLLVAQKKGYKAAYIEIDGSNIQQSYTVTLARDESGTSINAALTKSVTGNIGFWRCAATADESKLLLVGGMENWQDESIKTQSKLYLVDTNTGQTLWTHDMGWESWSADITDDGEYVVFATKLEGWQTGPTGFVNYIRLVNGTDGSMIWEKAVTSEEFPATTWGEFYSRGVKFSHSGEYIFVSVYGEYAYLLNTVDGSIKWDMWVGSEIREILFSQNDQHVYVPSAGGWLYKVNTLDGSTVWKQWIGCWPIVNGFDLSPNGEYIAVGTKGGTLTVIKTADGTVKFTTDIHCGTATCRFSPDSTKIVGGGDLLTMFDLNGNVLWRCYQEARDIRFSGDGKLVFTSNGGIFDSDGTMLNDILPGADRSSKIGWINSDATRYIFAIQDTETTTSTNVIEVYSIETTAEQIPEFQDLSMVLLMFVASSATICILKKRYRT